MLPRLPRHTPCRPPGALGVALLSAALLLAGCGTTTVNPVTGETERTVMSEQDEIETGAKQHEKILQEYGVYDNPRVQAYVNEVGQKLAAQSHRAQLKWTFTVLDSTEINAFALPGGYVYVTRGIMAYLDSEAELAGVIGHEIGHVTARHGARQATRQQTAGIGVVVASVLGAVVEGVTGIRGTSDLVNQVSQTAAQGYIASYSREQESQADALGAEYLVRNHYNPQNMVDVIKVLKNQERFAADMAKAEGKPAPSGPSWLASHPSNDKRLADITDIAARYAGQNAGQYDGNQRERYLGAIEGMTFGDSRAQGVTRGRNFYHEGLGFALTAPEGWRIQNSPAAIVMVNGAGDAGMAVKLVPPGKGNTPDEVVRGLVGSEQGGHTEPRSFNGLSAVHFDGVVRNDKGQGKNVSLTVVGGPGGHLYLMQQAGKDPAALQRNAAPLREAEASFRPLTAVDRQAARPWGLKAVAFPRGGFPELARSSPLPSPVEPRLKLINGVYGGEPDPRPGQLVKVVQ
jgi:predicted Zn-dependent protease